jgi:hypothetical protein
VCDDPLDGVGRDAVVDIASRREGHLVISQSHLHGNGSDDDDIVANPVEDLPLRVTGWWVLQPSPAHLGSNRVRRLKCAFPGRATVEVELHGVGDLDPLVVGGQRQDERVRR